MRRIFLSSAAGLAAALTPMPVMADASDAEIAEIIDEGLSHSQAMVSASELMDGIGPRLTNSENYDRAADWAIAKLRSYGLGDAHRESFHFGLGWNLDGWSATMSSPRRVQMASIPVGWSPPTDGPLGAPVILAPMSKPEHFEKWRGKLAGKIVMVSMPGTPSQSDKPQFKRHDGASLAALDQYDLPSDDLTPYADFVEHEAFPLELSRFLKSEGAVAMIRKSYRDFGLVSGEGYLYEPGATIALPFMELGAEDYRRLARLEMSGAVPVVTLDISARYDEGDLNADNIIADIKGSDPKAGYVMAGAHFDSWFAADGATDDGVPSALVIEAARILSSLGVKPKRTIRFALWAGEEQAIMGSTAYVEKYLAERPLDPSLDSMQHFARWTGAFPIHKKPGYDDLKAYFNLDNGAGRIRGIYAENNIGAVPLLSKWLSPFASMDATTVAMKRTGGTDHELMQSIGLPGFQFIQDPLDYGSRTHHSNIDTLDHAPVDDVRVNATILAAMLWQAANSDEELPRPPLPTAPSKSDPFAVEDPDKG